MKRVKVVLILMVLGAWLLVGAAVTLVDAVQKDNVRFLWAFGAVVHTAAGPELVAIKRNTTLPSQARLKLLVRLHEMAFIYVLHRDTHGNIQMLFPYSMAMFDGDYRTLKTYDIPPEALWLTLPEAQGQATVYLLASVRRLAQLEKTLSAYLAVPAPQKPDVARRVLDEMHQAKRRYGTLAAREERPIEIAGRRRSLAPDIGALAIEVTAHDFYSRTFTIDYR
jgi:hypothetical protein